MVVVVTSFSIDRKARPELGTTNLSINLKIAKTLGITIPLTFLALASRCAQIAASAYDSNWHLADDLCRSAIMVRFLRVSRRAGTGP